MTLRQHTEADIDKIKSLSKQEGLTHVELAERFGVSKTTIRQYLEERKQAEHLCAICGMDHRFIERVLDDPRFTDGDLHSSLRPDIDEYGEPEEV